MRIMARLHCLPDGKELAIQEGETILQACMREGVPHAQACGGQAKCSTCRVWILDGLENCAQRRTAEQSLAARLTFASQIRLACQTTVIGDVRFRRLVLDELDLDLTTQLARKRLGPCGESRDIAILFADIRDFTRLSQALSAYDVMYVLNRCMYQFGEIVETNGGHIDNIIGDGLMALFGTEGEPDAPLRSIKAAVEMLQAVDRMKPYMAAMYDQDFDIKIGVHYGEAVVGRLGTASHERLTAIGDAVNIASRIETANKEAGTRLLISEELHGLVESRVVVKDYIRVRLRGAEERRTLFEISGLTPEARRALSDGIDGDEQTQRFAGQLWHRVMDEAALPEGSRRVLERAEFDLQLVRSKGTVFAFNNACPHLNLPFNESPLTTDSGIRCRWHESCFDLATGAIRTWCDALTADGIAVGHKEIGNVSKNRRPMVVYPARISDGGIWVCFETG